MAILGADMGKCLSVNLSKHRFLFREQLKKSRDLKGGFVLDEEETKKMLETQSITYPEISEEKRFHPERLRPQMEAQAAASKAAPQKEPQEEDNSPVPLLNYYFHRSGTNEIDFAYSRRVIEAIGDCRQGYRTIDKDAFLSLRSRYSRMFFFYLSGNASQFQFKEQTVRGVFGIKNNYKRFSSLKPRLECVKKEFQRLGIDFQWEFSGGKNRSLIIQAKGMEQYHPSVQQNKELQPKAKELSEELVSFLKTKVKMNAKGIASNKKTFLAYIYFFEEKGLMDFLGKKMKTAGYLKAYKRIGYLIRAVQNETDREQASGRAEEKKTDIDNLKATDPRIQAMINDLAERKKIDSS
jgi:hypothetical protein